MDFADDLSGVYALTPHQQVTFWTGAIAQHDVALENAMRALAANVLLAFDLGRANFPKNFEDQRDLVKRVLKSAPLPDDLRVEGLNVLGRVKVAHKNRVALVHDMWAFEEGSDPPTFVVAHALMGRGWPSDPGRAWTLADFESAARKHARAYFDLIKYSMKVSDHRTDVASREFARASIALQLVGGPLNDQYRAVSRVADYGEASPTFTEGSVRYRFRHDGQSAIDGVVEYLNPRLEYETSDLERGEIV